MFSWDERMSPTTTATPPTLPRTAARSRQLVAASERTTLDPFREIDWSVPIDDSAFHLPPELLPLYGTPVWEAMSDTERIAYSRHETAALCGAGDLVRERAHAGGAAPPRRDARHRSRRTATCSSRSPTSAGTR